MGLERWMDIPQETVFPRVEMREIYIQTRAGLKQSDRFYAVVNPDVDWIYDVVTERYAIVKHEELISMVDRTLRGMGYRDYTTQTEFGGRYKARMIHKVLLTELKVNGDGLKFGFSITNSYDRSMGISANGYGFRLACMNQMVWGKEILQEYTMHTKEVHERLPEIIGRIIDGLERVHETIEMAMNDAITLTELAEIIEKLGTSKRLKLKIAQLINKYTGFDFVKVMDKLDAIEAEKVLLNRWQAYNALTDALTHYTQKIDPMTVHQMQKTASKVLVVASI